MILSNPPIGSVINWNHPLSAGLVGAWLFNEGGGSQAYNLVDGVGSLAVGGVLTSDGALYNGSSGYIRTPYSAKFAVVKGITIVTRIKRDTFGESDVILSNRVSGGHTFSVSAAGKLAYTYNGVADYISNLDVPSAYETNLSVVTNSTSAILRVDGLSQTISIGTPLASTGDYYCGVSLTSAGAISSYTDFRQKYLFYFNRALSATEIKSLHENPYQIIQSSQRMMSTMIPHYHYRRKS